MAAVAKLIPILILIAFFQCHKARANPTPCLGVGSPDDQISCDTRWINSGKLRRADLAFTLLERGALFLDDKQDYNRAFDDFNRAIQIYPKAAPDRWRAFCQRGNAYRAKGNLDQAISDYSVCLKNPDPATDTADIHFLLGRAYYEKGSFDQAVSELELSLNQFSMGRTQALLDQARAALAENRKQLICIHPVFTEERKLFAAIDGSPSQTDFVAAGINYLRIKYCRQIQGAVIDELHQDQKLHVGDNCFQFSGIFRGERVYWGTCYE